MRFAFVIALGLLFAAGLAFAGHLIARDTVALPVASIEAGDDLAPTRTRTQKPARTQGTTTGRTTTQRGTTTTRTETDDDRGRGRGRNRGRGGDDNSGSGSSGSGGDDD